MKKIYDLSVKVSSYVDRDGNTKNKYENVGTVMAKEDGNQFILLNRTFNPAGCPNPDNHATVIISMFEPRENDGNRTGNKPSDKKPIPPNYSENLFADDDIPY